MKLSLEFKGKNNIFTYTYIILMLLFYLGYVWMESHPFKPPTNNALLTQSDVENYLQLQKWRSGFEYMFLILFILTMILCSVRRNITILKGFFSVNIVLFVGITLIGYILFLIGPVNIGNLLEPLLIPMNLLGVVLVYMLWLWIFKKSSA